MRNSALRSQLNIFAGLILLTMMDVSKETKKRGGKESSCKIVINIPPLPASDFSCARLLIGKWWLFIEQLNWMMFDTFQWGLMNGVCRGLADLKASTYEAQGHISCRASIFFPPKEDEQMDSAFLPQHRPGTQHSWNPELQTYRLAKLSNQIAIRSLTKVSLIL